MSKSIVNFTKGVVAGVVVGTTVSMVMRGCMKMSSKKSHGNMFKNFGNVMSHITDMMK